MEAIHILGYVGALMIGLVLGLMGSGGSIMAVPIFTYLFQISPITTTAYSLFVVGASASVGAFKNFNKGLIDFKVAFIFAVPALFGVYVARKFLLPIIPDELFNIGNFVFTKNMGIMLLFSALMLAAALSMLSEKQSLKRSNNQLSCNFIVLIFGATLIGILTGLVGIGGGFIIIPVLVLFVKLPMKNAVATSLFIIALKSLIGFTGDVGYLKINWTFLLLFTMIAIFGIFLGIYLSSFVKGTKLKRGFGWLVLLMAIGVFLKEVFVWFF
ncbi:sulfite exporter TauE/SafE family protein [Aurantibacter sp.]|uniref:sulfite exporter TauE/SafE family protein n=1 Tax=Aurantibacter sp. TaxID=2807103 RepID=UPI003263B3EE